MSQPTVACHIDRPAPGTLALAGALTFGTAASTWAEAGQRLAAEPFTTLDLAGIEQVDSAGLACVLALLATRPGTLRAVHAPESLLALARVSDAEGWIGAAA